MIFFLSKYYLFSSSEISIEIFDTSNNSSKDIGDTELLIESINALTHSFCPLFCLQSLVFLNFGQP